MSQVVLLNPNINIVKEEKEHYAILDHLGLGLIGSSIEFWNNLSVTIIDGYALNIHKSDLIRQCLEENPMFVGITCNFIGINDALDIAREIKNHKSDVFIFMGGEHCTFSAESILNDYPFVDAIVRGEGEKTTSEMLFNIQNLELVDGIYYRDRNKNIVIKNKDRVAIENLDQIPFSKRNNLEYCEKHNQLTIIGMLAQRGCNFNCDFCNGHRFFRLGGGKTIRRRTPENIADEIELLYNKYYSQGIVEKMYFYDANFISGSKESKKWANDLANELIKRKTIISYEIYLRGDSIDPDIDQTLIDKLIASGLDSVFIGIESFDDDDLQLFDKKITAERCLKTVNFLIDNDIFGLTQGVIMFNPYSTFSRIRNTAKTLCSINMASFWNLSQKIQLFPGVKLIETLHNDNLLFTPELKNISNVYTYRFKDERIGKLSDYLISLNTNDIVINDNSIPRHIQGTIRQLAKKLNDYKDIESYLCLSQNEVLKQLTDINKLNLEFFLNITDAFEKDQTPKIINNITADYLDNSQKYVKKLDLYYSNVLENVNFNLDKVINQTA